MVKTENIILGSGKLYIAALENGDIPTNIVNDSNCVGDIQGGAELSYAPEIYEVVNDEGEVRKAFVSNEEVILKSGILTWNLGNIKKLAVGAEYDEATSTLTIGGKKSITQYAVAFVHEADFATITVTLKGYNQSGFTITFDKEKETVIDAEFKATKNTNGTLVTIKEAAKVVNED